MYKVNLNNILKSIIAQLSPKKILPQGLQNIHNIGN